MKVWIITGCGLANMCDMVSESAILSEQMVSDGFYSGLDLNQDKAGSRRQYS